MTLLLRRSCLAVLSLPVLLPGLAVAAQDVGPAKDVNNLGAVMLAFLFGVVVVIASFMSPKRTHED